MTLNISVHLRPGAEHQYQYGGALILGMRKHGLYPRVAGHNEPCASDIAVIWSWKQMQVINAARLRGAHVLVIERGFLPLREEWCSLAFDGLNGRGKFAPARDGGERWRKHFAQWLKPWRKGGKGHALLIGQVPGDPALCGMNMDAWIPALAHELMTRNMEVVYRPHPALGATYPGAAARKLPAGVRLSTGTLDEDLAGAALCVTYTSNTAVESVLAGVPAMAFDQGSIAWPMVSHDIDAPFFTPDRVRWCHDMAWRQWKIDELADGSAWEHVRQCI